MIQAKDLMLGNWVEYATGLNKDKRSIPMYVKAIFRDEVYLDFDGNEGDVWEEDAENLLGIPITEELLDKMGDKIRNGLKCGDVIIRFSRGKATVRPIVGFGEITGLRYLHELQNAYFMLTKKHLDIKL